MDFAKIPSGSLLGRMLRLPLRFVPKSARMPVLQGPMRGMWWTVGSSTHGCWLGTYEMPKQLLFSKLVNVGDSVWDIGAHVGFYSLLAARIVGPSGSVVAFEPLPENIAYLRQHLKLNDLTNVRIIDAAVTDTSGEMNFAKAESRYMGALDSSGAEGVRVTTVQLDELFQQGGFVAPDLVKIDIEGAEVDALNGASRLLSRSKPTIFLATHGDDLRRACITILRQHGYDLYALNGAEDELVAVHPDIPGNAQLVPMKQVERLESF